MKTAINNRTNHAHQKWDQYPHRNPPQANEIFPPTEQPFPYMPPFRKRKIGSTASKIERRNGMGKAREGKNKRGERPRTDWEEDIDTMWVTKSFCFEVSGWFQWKEVEKIGQATPWVPKFEHFNLFPSLIRLSSIYHTVHRYPGFSWLRCTK